jgi:hypothetical protein
MDWKKKWGPISKIFTAKRVLGMVQAIESLLSKYKILS